MGATHRTSLSAGVIIRDLLLQCEGVTAITQTVFPVAQVVEDVKEAYIYYARNSLSQQPVKTGRGADSIMMEVNCCSRFYDESVELAEAARMALDGVSARSGDLVMRSCTLEDSSEGWEDDVYVQQLIFNIKIS